MQGETFSTGVNASIQINRHDPVAGKYVNGRLLSKIAGIVIVTVFA